MIVVSDVLDAEVAGTSVGDRLIASVWRGGQLVVSDLALSSWSLAWDAGTGEMPQGRATVVAADPDGLLAPWGMGDALAPGGSRVRLSWVSGSSGIRVPRGVWRIRRAKPAESWRVYRGGRVARVSGGGSVALTLEEDPVASITPPFERLDGDAPGSGSVVAELRRVLQGMGAVDVSAAPADRTVPVSYTAWPSDSRLDAVGDLLDMLGASCRVGGDGALQVVPAAGVGPVWTVAGGEAGVLIEAVRELGDDGVYNAATSRGTADDQTTPLVGRAYLTTGPLAWGGPYGRVPIFHQAIATSQGGVNADARSYLATVTDAGTVDLAVSCLAHPALQLQDVVTVWPASVAGDVAVSGRVVSMRWSSAQSDGGSTPGKAMTLTVRVSTDALDEIAARVRRG